MRISDQDSANSKTYFRRLIVYDSGKKLNNQVFISFSVRERLLRACLIPVCYRVSTQICILWEEVTDCRRLCISSDLDSRIITIFPCNYPGLLFPLNGALHRGEFHESERRRVFVVTLCIKLSWNFFLSIH